MGGQTTTLGTQLANRADDKAAVFVGVADGAVGEAEVAAFGETQHFGGRSGFARADLGRAEAAKLASGQVDDGGAAALAGGLGEKAPAAELGVVGVGVKDDELAGILGNRHASFIELHGSPCAGFSR